MRPRHALWTGLSIGASGLVAGIALAGAGASPAAVLDQNNPARSAPCRFIGWIPDTPTSWAGQTFTAGITGYLTDVVLRLRGTGTQIVVSIAPVDAAGMPIAASPLASVTVPFTPAAGFGDVPFTFPTPAKVDSGKQYAVLIVAPTTNFSGSAISWQNDGGSSLRDVNGTACADGAYAGGRAWASDPAPPGADADFFFSTYVVPVRHLTVQRAGGGSGTVQDGTGAINCGSTCTAEFKAGESISLTATPATTSLFAGWSGVCSGATPSCAITIDADVTVTAVFTKKPSTLIVRRTGSGFVSSRPAGIKCGTQCRRRLPSGAVTLTARPSRGWAFARWAGACGGKKPVCHLSLAPAASKVVTAVFTRKAK